MNNIYTLSILILVIIFILYKIKNQTSATEERTSGALVKRHTFGHLAKTRAVRKEELLRSMVSQGRPDPLRHSFKVLRSDAAKIKAKL